jgi:hypothetical protein
MGISSRGESLGYKTQTTMSSECKKAAAYLPPTHGAVLHPPPPPRQFPLVRNLRGLADVGDDLRYPSLARYPTTILRTRSSTRSHNRTSHP